MGEDEDVGVAEGENLSAGCARICAPIYQRGHRDTEMLSSLLEEG